MNKRKEIIIIVLLLIASSAISDKFFPISYGGFDIQIKNNTSEAVDGLNITYKNASKDIKLPQIEAGKMYKVYINPKENFVENSMLIYYKDKRDYTQKNTLIDYFEKGYGGKVKIDINSQDQNGLIIMRIQEEVS